MRNAATKAQACFVVEGAFITSLARTWVLEDEPSKAWRFLAENLGGESNGSSSTDAARKILTGTHELVGDSTTGVELVPATKAHDVAKYLASVRWLYAGRVKIEGRWYQPSGVVMAYGVEDALAAKPTLEDFGPGNTFKRRRAQYYAGRGERVELVSLDVDLTGHGHLSRHDMFVTFAPCGEPPPWLSPAKDPQAAVDEFVQVRTLERLGADCKASYTKIAEQLIATPRTEYWENDDRAQQLREAAYAADDAAEAEYHARLREVILRQANGDLLELATTDGRTLQVPRAPFVRWCFDARWDESPEDLPTWEPVCPSGLKLMNDNRYHTDWLIGAGLHPRDAYKDEINKPAWRLLAKLQRQIMGLDDEGNE